MFRNICAERDCKRNINLILPCKVESNPFKTLTDHQTFNFFNFYPIIFIIINVNIFFCDFQKVIINISF